MLPGFRFLFAAIVLSMSILVFGLGAAALLRAAHEDFASTPSWRASPEPVFAQQPETTTPVLAMLHVDPPAAEAKALDPIATAATPAEQPATSAKPAESEVTEKPAEPEVPAKLDETAVAASPAEPKVTAAPAEPERTAALQPENSSPPETAKPEMPAAENPAPQEPVPAQTVAPATADETKLAASTPAPAPEDVSAATSQAAAPAPEQASSPASADPDIASTKIATLGGPPVAIEAPPRMKITVATHYRSAVRKHAEAHRKARHHRVASRARAVQQWSQQPADPFGQSYAASQRR
jgi:outer membrane biosynthesis protein TonB